MGTPTYLNISTQLTPQPFNTDTTKQVLLIGQRLTNVTSASGVVTTGVFRPAKGGYLQPDYYAPISLPSFQDGNSALEYLSQLGFRTQIGETISTTFSAPLKSASSTSGITSIVWTTPPVGFTVLTSGVISGTVTQIQTTGTNPVSVSKGKLTADAPQVITVTGTVNATIISGVINSDGTATLNVNNLTFSTPAGGTLPTAFNLTNDILLNGIDNNGYPDPTGTDPIALLVWDFYQAALSANTSVVGAPTAFISVTNGDATREGGIRPSVSPIAIGAPTAVAGTTGVVELTYPINGANLGWLPLTAVGNIVLTQTIVQPTPAPPTPVPTPTGTLISTQVSGSNIVITVAVLTGTFVVGVPASPLINLISVVLDNTIDVFDYLENIPLYAAVLQFPINTLKDITNNQLDFYNGVASLNLPSEALNGHYGTYAIAGNVLSLPNQAGALPVADDEYKILVTYPYYPSFGDIVYESNYPANTNLVASGRIASAVAYMLANGDAPFPALKLAVIKHLPVASSYVSTSYSRKQGGNGNIAINQGWLPLTVNPQGVVYILQSNTTLITIPNTSIPNVEFSYTHIWDCVRVIKQLVAELFNNSIQLPNNTGSANLSLTFVSNFQAAVVSGLYTLQSAQVVFNVGAYASLVTANIDSNDPSQLDVYVPSQIIPQFNGANILINVFSANYVFNQQQ